MKSQKSRKAWKDRLDKVTSGIVRRREWDDCEVCEVKHEDGEQHHVFGKATNALHYYIPGIVWVCRNCHIWLGDHPQDNEWWYINKYGQAAWDKLVELRRTTGTTLEAVEEMLKGET